MQTSTLFRLLPALAVLLTVKVQAQAISLTNANMPGSGDTLRYTNVSTTSLPAYQATGANFTWDFTQVASTTEGIRSFKASSQTPYFFFFFGTQEYGELISNSINLGVITLNDYYNFYKKQSSPAAYIADGAGMTLSMVPVPAYYTDKDELYKFPMTYPQYDSTTFKFTTPTTSLIPVRYSKAGYRVTVVDGYGTVKTPYGTENCIRLVTTQYSRDTIRATLGTFTLPPVGIPNFVRSYQWLTLNSKIPYMEVTGNLVGNNFTITQARYRGYDMSKNPPKDTQVPEQMDLSGMRMFPNPAASQLFVTLNTPSTLAVYDLNGRLVKAAMDVAVSGVYPLDVADLEQGLYVLKVTEGNRSEMIKFIKVNP
jgi:hypothetical protein